MKLLYNGFIYEARNLNRISNYLNRDVESTISSESPLKDTEVVTVYHGIAYLRDAIKILTEGLDGSLPVNRKDEYEKLENPHGLFVSPSLKTAEYFANSGYIIEFNSRVSDLEAPIWNAGSDREFARIEERNTHSSSDNKFIKDADRPELANTISRRIEPQALFIGKLLPNQIKTVWYSSEINPSNSWRDQTNESWKRMSRIEAINQIKKGIK